MKLDTIENTVDSPWQSWQVIGSPFGIERIDSNCFFIYRVFGSRRVYLNQEESYPSKAKAITALVPKVKQYNLSIVHALND